MIRRAAPARRRAAILAALAVCFAGVALALIPRGQPLPARNAHPTLLLITSLPLLFGEEFGLKSVGSPALKRLERDFTVRPIGAADRAGLNGQRLLLMAHPRAQPAELLVALDRWVRRGGQLLLLADPKLDWPSERPLGDTLRPPAAFADTGLLAHWGLALDGPQPDGPASMAVGGYAIATASPGRLRIAGEGGCALAADGFIARCTIGRGRAVIIADADFLNVAGDDAGQAKGALDGPTGDNLDFIAGELKGLTTRN